MDKTDPNYLRLGVNIDHIATVRNARGGLQALCADSKVPLNMEMAVTDEMEVIAAKLKPHAICLVPERREERTTEGGLNVIASHNRITALVSRLSENGSRLSLFIEAVPEQIAMAARTGAPVIELHTGAYAHAIDDGDHDKRFMQVMA